jgi:predicted Zn-dependent protease
MRKIIIQTLVLVLMFWGAYKLLERVDWIKILHIEAISRYSEEKLGELMWQSILNQHEISYDNTLNNAVDSIFNTICRSNELRADEYKIHVVRNDEANAFAMPGKYILIYTGLIAQSESAAEIAGVIAHELAHINRNHIEQKLMREIGLGMLIGMTTGNSDPGMIQNAIQLLASTAFDRESEKEADITAVTYMQNAQQDPEHFARILLRISKETPGIRLSWISTHPESIKRANYIRNMPPHPESHYVELFDKAAWQEIVELAGD